MMSISKCKIPILAVCLLRFNLVIGAEVVYDVRDHGAKADGEKLCTEAIQNAVDKCAASGGGTVYLPPGKWLSGTVYLGDHVTLRLDSGSILLGSRDPKDYAHRHGDFSSWSLIAGKGLEHVAIRGSGIIDVQGSAFRWKDRSRPKGIYIENCRDILIEGVGMRSAGSWMQHYFDCDRLTIRDISVFNHVAYNNDGLNIDSCRDVRISGCVVDSDDDGIVLKSRSLKPCENVTISDCVVSSHCNSIKMGTESGGGFQNITVTNCTICSPRYSKVTYGRQRGLAGLALEIVDGGILDRVAISNITIKGVSVPIFMRLGNRARQYGRNGARPGVGTFRNVVVNNIVATDVSNIGCSITGLPGHVIENVSMSNIKLSFEGGGTREDALREIPEKATSYPESTMFGTLPAYGFYCRHVKGLTFTNVRLRTTATDLRHAMVFEDAANITIEGLDSGFWPGAAPSLRFIDTRAALVRGCRPAAGTSLFLKLQGSQSERIFLTGNDFSGVEKIAETGREADKNALVEIANYVGE